ncbi:MAG: type II secretion system minor pseudopilin GspJ [Pseudomonadota bacterium]
MTGPQPQIPAPASRRDAGFTLVEVMIATFIMAILTAMGSMLLRDAIGARDGVETVVEEIQGLTLARSILKTDLAQIMRRDVRGEYGEPSEQVFSGGDLLSGNSIMAFVRNGRHTVGRTSEGSTLEYVAYTMDDGNLVRRSRAIIDAVPGTPWVERILLTDVPDLEARFLSETGWVETWDARGQGAGNRLPGAVELTFTHPRFGDLRAVMLTVEGY